jgi:hypothetical protein
VFLRKKVSDRVLRNKIHSQTLESVNYDGKESGFTPLLYITGRPLGVELFNDIDFRNKVTVKWFKLCFNKFSIPWCNCCI